MGAVLGLAGLFLVLRYTPIPDAKLRGDFSKAFLSSEGNLLNIQLSQSGKIRIPIHLEDVSPELVKGLLGYEDRWFYWHPGVNPVALARALGLNLLHRRVVSGGSTLTLQLAKLLSPRRRTVGAKAIEIVRALQLEARYSKRQILEDYLNLAPMGGNLEGVAAASLLYYGKMPRDLSWGEAALLISLPRSPSLRRPDVRPLKAKEGRDRVLDRLRDSGALPPDRVAEAYAAPIPEKRQINPKLCPHLVNRVAEQSPPGFARLSVRLPVQELAERALRRESGGLQSLGVHNGSVVVVDNRTMEVAAYVGSPDFNDRAAGQVNGADILRSPGSALKPFLYCLAVQQGRLTPKDMVYDLPRDWGGYKPSNFEATNTGPIRAGDALAESLNLPAVWLEASMHASGEGLDRFMADTGFTDQGRDRLDPGLSLVLGAYPVSLEELASLYAILARGGVLSEPRFTPAPQDGSQPPGKRLLKEGPVFIVDDMLAQVTRPDLPATWEFSPQRSKVAFKTGTSFGFKDAWCGAVTPRWTVAVWMGNASAEGNSALTGAKAAAPVAFEILNALTAKTDEWFQPPPGVSRREVCRLTGRPLGPNCPQSEEDWYLPGISRTDPCPVHQKIWIRKKDGKEVCLHCMTGKPSEYRSRVVEIWPPEVAQFLKSSGQRYEPIPEHNPDCPDPPERPAPRVVSPDAGGRYVLTDALPRDVQRLGLAAQASPDAKALYWFKGKELLGKVRPDGMLFWALEPGEQVLSVVDSAGRAAAVTIEVEDLRKPAPEENTAHPKAKPNYHNGHKGHNDHDGQM